MAVEVIVLKEMFLYVNINRNELDVVFGKPIHVLLLADKKLVLDMTSRGTRTLEKRAMLDIVAGREVFRNQLMSDIGLVRIEYTITDDLKNK